MGVTTAVLLSVPMTTFLPKATEAAAGPGQLAKGEGDCPLIQSSAKEPIPNTARPALFANKFFKCLKSAAHHLIENDSAFHVSHLKRCNYTPGDETLTIL